MRIRHALLIGVVLALASTVRAQGPSASAPMTEKDVVKELKSAGPDQLIKAVSLRGTDFDMTPEIEKRLRKAKATDQVIQAVTSAGPKARAAAKAAALGMTGPPLSPAESKDFAAVRDELDPDKAVALAEDFAKKYPNSSALTYAYAFEAGAYQQKGDVEKVVDLCEKSLGLNKDNLMSLILVSGMIPQPQYLNQRVDKEKQLTAAESYAQDALKLLDKVPKLPNESDADLAKRKAEYAAGVHSALGMVHLDRAQLGLTGVDKDELAKAEQEYQVAVTTTEHPDSRDYYRLGETTAMEGKLDDAIAAFTKAGELGQGTMIKQIADEQIENLKKRKAQSTPPAKP